MIQRQHRCDSHPDARRRQSGLGGVPCVDRFSYRPGHRWHRRGRHDRRIATVNVEEHELLIAEAVEHAAGRIPVIAGTGANSTKEAIELAAFSKKAGADASLTVVPYYNKPTQEGLVPAFQGHRRSGGYAAYSVQRAGAHRGGYEQRHGAASGADSQHRRHQGRDRQTSSAAAICCSAHQRISRSTAATMPARWR